MEIAEEGQKIGRDIDQQLGASMFPYKNRTKETKEAKLHRPRIERATTGRERHQHHEINQTSPLVRITMRNYNLPMDQDLIDFQSIISLLARIAFVDWTVNSGPSK